LYTLLPTALVPTLGCSDGKKVYLFAYISDISHGY